MNGTIVEKTNWERNCGLRLLIQQYIFVIEALYEIWTGIKINLSNLKIVGPSVIIHVPKNAT